MAVTSLLDTSLPETVLSEEKSQQIIDLIIARFNEGDHTPVAKLKETLLEGDRNDDTHMMSRKMMQTYIGSYWYHFSEQIPIRTFISAISTLSRLSIHSAQANVLARQDPEPASDCNDGHWCFMLGQDAWLRSHPSRCRVVKLLGMAFTMGDLQ
jgi:hypothetical protein